MAHKGDMRASLICFVHFQRSCLDMEVKSKINLGLTLLIVGIMLLAVPMPHFGADIAEPQQDDTIPMSSTIYVGEYVFDFNLGEPRMDPKLMAQPTASGEVGVFIVHMTGPIPQEWTDRISDSGAEIVTYVHNFAYQVRMTPEVSSIVETLPFVDWVGAYHPAYKISPDLSGNGVSISFYGENIPASAIQAIYPELAVLEESQTGPGYTMRGELLTSASLDIIAANPYVQYISPIYVKELHDEAGMQVMGGGLWQGDNDANHATPYRVSGSFGSKFNQVTGASGSGITIGVADTGLGTGAIGNAGHPDFENRVIGGYSYDNSDFADGHGHGTHCAGLAAANGYAGTGRTYAGFGPYYAGMGLGYDANLFSVKIFSDAGGFIGPTDDGDILVRSYTGGARVSSNSWGAPTGGDYIDSDSNYDMRVRDASTAGGNQQISVLVSAGNSGSGTNTIGSPGNAKNVITVGGVENYMPDASSYGNTYSTVADNPDVMYTSSSRGWTDDGRIKPDIVTPGVNTLSTHSPNAPSNNLFGLYSQDNRYEWCTGTSQSCPTAAGGAAAVNEWYIDTQGATPTPAMTKAILINTAKDIGTADIPNQNEGWGRMMLNTISDNPNYFYFKDAPGELTTGAYHDYQVSYIDNTKPLKVTLVWTDRYAADGAAITLINDLRLRVTAPLGQVYNGNAFTSGYTPSGTNPIATFDTNSDGNDDRNNVECVYISTAGLQTGFYNIRVSGFNIVGDCDNDGANDQDYALVIYNGIDVTSKGTIDIEKTLYPREASVLIEVKDKDLNTNTNVQTVNVNLKSNAEPAGESVTLTETGGDTGIFRGTKTISATNSVGVVMVNAADTITATYTDANDGEGHTNVVVTDTATVEGDPPAAPTGLAVTWTGAATQELFNEAFGTYPPTGWGETDPTNDISTSNTANAGGTSPEVRFDYYNGNNIWRLYSKPVDTSGMSNVDMQFRTFYDDYSATYPCVVKVQTSKDGTTWNDAGWSRSSGSGNFGPALVSFRITNSDVGSSTFRIAFTAEGNTFGYDYWYVDSARLNYTGAGLTADNKLTWTKSTDDGAGDNDVDHYNIYRSSSSSGPWDVAHIITTVPKATIQYIDLGKGEIDGINWWYVVRAVDTAGNMDSNTNAVPEIAPSGATATATGPTGGPSIVAGITITYTYTGTPTSVRLFYTTNGGTSWTLAGTDNSVDGSFGWTCPAAGTYGWIAVAVGGSTIETDPAGGIAPEAASYIYDNVAPTITATTFADGATGVTITAGNYDADFSENMAAVGTVTTNLPGATYSWVDANTYRITYTALSYSTTYTTTYATTFRDVAGNALGGDRVKTFTTGAAPAATATATGPTGGPTTVTGITITYTYTGIPTSVNLYYTLNGGTSWTLAGNDGTVDGNYAWTCPGSGTYGWIASAVGGSSTEPSPPSGGTLPESTSYIVDLTPPAARGSLTVEHYGVSTSSATATCSAIDSGDTALTTTAQILADDGTVATNAKAITWLDAWNTGTGSNPITGATLRVEYSVVTGYTGTNSIRFSLNEGGAWTSTGITPAAGQTNIVATFNLFAAGVDTLAEIQTLDIEFTSNDGAAPSNVYFDYFWVEFTYGGGGGTDDNAVNWTKSSDDGSGSNDVDQYMIYRSDVSTGPWDVAHIIATVAATGAAIYSYIDAGKGTADATLWWYVVRAEDTLGNIELNTNAVQEPGITTPYSISLAGKAANSWVFVSFPSGLTGNIQDILTDAIAAGGDGGTTWSVAKWYNPLDSADHWKSYRVGGTANDMPSITNAMGVWLWITANGGDQAITLSSYAAIPASTVINMYAGWNLVGYPSTTDRSGTTTPGAVDMISVYSGSAAYTDYASAQKNLVTLHHGNAYFMHATADTIWTVTNP